jgi:NYN domain
MATDNSGALALLIDGDNASPKIVVGLMAEIANYGVASVKRIYGDWTGPNLKGWKECLPEHSIQPVQQFAYTTGKNATDGAMIIDAMDLLYTGRFSGFCIVSSDSDFARLAARIREQGVTVYGFGERKTPLHHRLRQVRIFRRAQCGRRTEGNGTRRCAEGSGGQTGAGENGSGSHGA